MFSVEAGRALRDMKNAAVPNVITVGLNQLSGPLADYNQTFQQLQQRQREDPLTDEISPPSSPDATQSMPSDGSSGNTPAVPSSVLNSTDGPATVSLPLHTMVCKILTSYQNINYGATSFMARTSWEDGGDGDDDDDDDFYWRAVEEDYNPQRIFAEEEEPSLDIDDYF